MEKKNNLILKKSYFECAKIASKRAKIISEKQFEDFLPLSFSEIIKFLEEHGFRESVDSSYLNFEGFYLIERILNSYFSKVYSQILNTSSKSNKEFLEIFYFKFQIHNIMTLIRMKSVKADDIEPFLIGDEKKKNIFLKAFDMETIEDSISYLSKKFGFNEKEVLDAYSKGIFFLENYLYKTYYENLVSNKIEYNSRDEKYLCEFLKNYIDLLNSRTFIKLHIENDEKISFKELFISSANIKYDFFEKLEAKSIEEILKKLNEKIAHLGNNEKLELATDIDKKINDFNLNSGKFFKSISFGSPFFILKFLFDIEKEIARLRILLKSKHLNLSQEDTQKLLFV